jgi:hypothetical protein
MGHASSFRISPSGSSFLNWFHQHPALGFLIFSPTGGYPLLQMIDAKAWFRQVVASTKLSSGVYTGVCIAKSSGSRWF